MNKKYRSKLGKVNAHLKLLLNYEIIEDEINDHLKRLKGFSISENDKSEIDQLAKCVSKIHSHNLNKSNLPLYGYQWVIDLVTSENCKHKTEIITALKMMSKMEYYNTGITVKFKDKKFLTWNIDNSDWQTEYKTGHVGSYVWDIAAIINYVNDSKFSDTFLESYMRYGGNKPAIIEIYANLYYVQVAEAVKNDNLENIMQTTKEIIDQNIFRTELISYNTLNRLQILGY